MSQLEKRVYLASRSPRRRELLKQMGVNYEVLMLRSHPESRADVDERPLGEETPEAYCLRVATEKAEAGWARLTERRLPRFPILSADTTVTVDHLILGKPTDAAHAEQTLERLSGREHEVITSVVVAYENQREQRTSVTRVRFRELSLKDIREYVKTGEPMDKAGAYGIQGRAGCFVAHLSGSYSGVMGLPLYETAELLRGFGVIVP